MIPVAGTPLALRGLHATSGLCSEPCAAVSLSEEREPPSDPVGWNKETREEGEWATEGAQLGAGGSLLLGRFGVLLWASSRNLPDGEGSTTTIDWRLPPSRVVCTN